MSALKEKDLTAITPDPDRDAEVEAAVSAVQNAERALAALHAGAEKASAKLNALERTRATITLDAVESGISAPLDKLDVAVAAAKLDLARSETALQAAQDRLTAVNQKLHLASHDQTIKLLAKLMKQRMKHANTLAEHVAGLADSYQRLLDASERIQVAIPWPRGIVPSDGQLYAPAICARISRELMRVRPVNPITVETNPPLPGAFLNPHAGNPTGWKSLVEEFQASCDFLVGVVTEVPK
jgi:hypothetical protein